MCCELAASPTINNNNLQAQSNPDTVSPSRSVHESLWAEIPYELFFRIIATNCSEQRVALFRGLTVFVIAANPAKAMSDV